VNTLKYIIKKYGLSASGKSPVDIPRLGRAELARLFAELGFTKGAEVGVWQGDYTQVLCRANPNLSLFGIDLTSKTARNAVPSRCKLIRMASMTAAKKFVNASLDFVYLNTNHQLGDAIQDIREWSKKVRPGGIVAGYDYFRYRYRAQRYTYQAVTAYTGTYRVSPWFVAGREVDRIRSWFWVKA